MKIEPINIAAELQDLSSSRSSQYRHDLASYIAEMLKELRTMAEQAHLGKAVRSIDAAYYDVFAAAGGVLQKKGRPQGT